MSQPRLIMRQIKEILRYHYELHLSNERICQALQLSKGSVYNTLKRFKKTGLMWSDCCDLPASMLQEKLYLKKEEHLNAVRTDLPDYAYIHKELLRPHVTLALLYDEYRRDHLDGICRSSFYEGFNRHLKVQKVDMPVIHKAGDKLFVDYSGDSFEYIDLSTGEIKCTQLFISTWGASNYSYAEVSEDQSGKSWVYSHVNAFKFFNCTSQALVPDNLKSAVLKPDIYEPKLNPLYAKMAEHYHVAILPARVRKPKDKAKVECHVLHLQRHLLGRLRNRSFFSLQEINSAICEELVVFNNRPMKAYGGQSRLERFVELDYPNAKILPEEHFAINQIAENRRVLPNYHVLYDNHYYSVPYHLVDKKVTLHEKGSIIEIYQDGVHICRHQKGTVKYGYTTKMEHMSQTHQHIKRWDAGYFIFKAGEIGSHTSTAVKKLFENKKHEEININAARGLLKLAGIYGTERMENACQRAIHYQSTSYKYVKNILKMELDKKPIEETATEIIPITHENLRGETYYTNL